MTVHGPRRSWLRLGIWRCACGRPVGHSLPAQQVGAPIPDGDVVLVNGYRRSTDVLTEPRNVGRWTR